MVSMRIGPARLRDSQRASNMNSREPESVQNYSPGAFGRPHGGPWATLGESLGARVDFERFWLPLGIPLGGSNI